jgi:class 3 adenylate cyclase/tetratricopeptide (TPR) repeat protein
MLSGQVIRAETQGDEELRKVTVIFSDLSGYTAMSEYLGPEETKAITSQIFSEAAAIARKNDGCLDRLIGDCALMLFGIPHLHEDDVVRALMTATEIHAFVESLNTADLVARIGRRLAMHTGVNTGTVLAGQTDLESGVETVVGDPVNLASRLKDAARGGQILVGPLCWRYTREEFEYRALEPLFLKGKERPVQAYELLSRRPKEARSKAGALDREVHSALVGREKELELLDRQALNLIAGEGSIVFVRGEAGVGKSRLLTELRRKERMGGALLLEGSAQSIGKNLSFHPFIEMLNSWAGIKEEDCENETRRKLEAAVQEATREEAGEIFPFVAIMRGLKLEGAYAERVNGLPGDALAKLIAKSVRDLIRALSRQKPVILFLDDLHWADQSSLELLEGLFRLVGKERVCFIAALRPSEPNTEKLVEKTQELYKERSVLMDLPTLSATDSEEMVSHLLRNRAVSKNVLDLLIERTGGNPFFIEEIVRSWIDEGAVRVSKEGFQVTEQVHAGDIPYTINQAIMARIDRLGEETREVLRIAAVIGRSFFYRIIAQLAENVGSLDSKIENLKAIQLIVERRRLEEVEFLFKHALVQQAIYDSLLVRERKKLHARVAQVIKTIFAERLSAFYGVLAYHYCKAEDFSSAKDFMIKAGEEAMRASASSEAIRYFKEALDIYYHSHGSEINAREMALLEKNLAIAYLNKGLHSEAIGHFTAVLRMNGISESSLLLVRMVTLPIKLVSCLRSIYIPLWNWKRKPSEKDIETINLMAFKGESLFNVDPKGFISFLINAFYFIKSFDLSYVSAGYGMLSSVAMAFCLTGISLRVSDRILRFLAEKIDSNDIRSRLLHEQSVATQSYLAGSWSDWLFDEALIVANLKRGELFFTINYLSWAGRIFLQSGRFREAESLGNMLADISSSYASDFAQAIRHLLCTNRLVQMRRIESAYAEITRGLDFIKNTNFLMLHFMLNYLKVRIDTLRGDTAGAERALADATRMDKELKAYAHYRSGFLLSALHYYFARLEQSVRVADRKAAEKYRRLFSECLRREHRLLAKVASDRTEAYRVTGNYHWLSGRTRVALGWWKASLDQGDKLGARLELSRTYFEIGRRVTSTLMSRSLSATKRQMLRAMTNRHLGLTEEDCLCRAEILFREMNLQKDLEELQELKRVSVEPRADIPIKV